MGNGESKELEPCGHRGCKHPASKHDPYGGLDVCEGHYHEFVAEQFFMQDPEYTWEREEKKRGIG